MDRPRPLGIPVLRRCIPSSRGRGGGWDGGRRVVGLLQSSRVSSFVPPWCDKHSYPIFRDGKVLRDSTGRLPGLYWCTLWVGSPRFSREKFTFQSFRYCIYCDCERSWNQRVPCFDSKLPSDLFPLSRVTFRSQTRNPWVIPFPTPGHRWGTLHIWTRVVEGLSGGPRRKGERAGQKRGETQGAEVGSDARVPSVVGVPYF